MAGVGSSVPDECRPSDLRAVWPNRVPGRTTRTTFHRYPSDEVFPLADLGVQDLQPKFMHVKGGGGESSSHLECNCPLSIPYRSPCPTVDGYQSGGQEVVVPAKDQGKTL